MLGTDIASVPTRPRSTFGAFRYRNYRLFLFSTVVSQVGTWMQYIAEGLLVYRLTEGPLALGLLGFLPMLPLAPLMLVAGALADRLPRRPFLILVQLAAACPPLVLAILTWTGQVQVWHVIVVEVLIQGLMALDHPARQALLVDTVEVEDLDTGVALTASVFNLARVVGPALGGVLAAWAGEGVCFALNALSFLASGLALWLLRLPRREMKARRESVGTNLVGGIRYIARDRLLLAALGLTLLVSLFIMPYQRFLPVLALDTLGSGEEGVGFLNALAGLGAVLGAVLVAWLMSRWPGRRGRLIVLFGLALPVAAACFALSRSYWLSLLVVLLVGAGVVAVRALAYTVVQIYVRDELRGRALSILLLLSVGAVRAGELGVGLIADRTGISLPLILGAVGCLVGMAALAALVPELRRTA